MSSPFAPQLPPSDSRDDLDLCNRVRSYLFGKHYASLRQLQVEVLGDTVLLAGRVDSFYERQVAVACAQRVAGVRQVTDRIAVRDARLCPARPASDVEM